MSLSPAVFVRCEHLIRNGQASSVAEKIKTFIRRKLSRADRVELAGFSYRVGLAEIGLRLLHATLRPTGSKPSTASDQEKAIYAQCLIRVGAIEEALGLLSGADSEKVPLVLFARAAAWMGLWDYGAALPVLRDYLKCRGLSPYPRLVAQTNLAACLMSTGRFRESTALLRKLLYETSLKKLALLHANALELSAQNYYLQKKWKPALECLDRAASDMAGAGTRDTVFVRKWRAILTLARDGAGHTELAALAEVRQMAREQRDWETVRECDAYRAKATKETTLFWAVFFATPYPAYRTSLLRENPEYGDPPPFYWWGGESSPNRKPKLFLDVETARGTNPNDSVKPNGLLHRLLLALTLDLYRPIRGATLFAHLFPREFYNPQSSPARIHEAIKRLRTWIAKNQFPLSITEQGGAYALEPGATLSLKLPLHNPLQDLKLTPLARLRREFGARPFGSLQAARFLSLSQRAAQRILSDLVTTGEVRVSGRINLRRYQIQN